MDSSSAATTSPYRTAGNPASTGAPSAALPAPHTRPDDPLVEREEERARERSAREEEEAVQQGGPRELVVHSNCQMDGH